MGSISDTCCLTQQSGEEPQTLDSTDALPILLRHPAISSSQQTVLALMSSSRSLHSAVVSHCSGCVPVKCAANTVAEWVQFGAWFGSHGHIAKALSVQLPYTKDDDGVGQTDFGHRNYRYTSSSDDDDGSSSSWTTDHGSDSDYEDSSSSSSSSISSSVSGNLARMKAERVLATAIPVRQLDLSFWPLSSNAAQHFVQLTGLTHLSLEACLFEQTAPGDFAEALLQLTGLQRLGIVGLKLAGCGVDGSGASARARTAAAAAIAAVAASIGPFPMNPVAHAVMNGLPQLLSLVWNQPGIDRAAAAGLRAMQSRLDCLSIRSVAWPEACDQDDSLARAAMTAVVTVTKDPKYTAAVSQMPTDSLMKCIDEQVWDVWTGLYHGCSPHVEL